MKSRIVDWAIALQPLQPQVIIRHRSPPLRLHADHPTKLLLRMPFAKSALDLGTIIPSCIESDGTPSKQCHPQRPRVPCQSVSGERLETVPRSP